MGTSDFGEPAVEELATCLVGRLRVTSRRLDSIRIWSAPPRKADVDEPICHVGYGPIEELTDNFTALFNVLT